MKYGDSNGSPGFKLRNVWFPSRNTKLHEGQGKSDLIAALNPKPESLVVTGKPDREDGGTSEPC